MKNSLFSKTPKPFSCSEIKSKYDFRPKIKNKSTYLHDLSCTLAINLNNISQIKNTEKITINQMDIIRNKVSIILKLFKNLRKIQKNNKSIKSQILVHNQLLHEIKRRNQEGLLMLQQKKLDLIKALDKKQIICRKSKKKFNDVEIYIRRESQLYKHYKNLYRNFTMDSFIIKNTNILNIIKNKKNENENVLNLINFIINENKENKNKFLSQEKKQKYKNISLNNLSTIHQDKIKYFENYIKEMDNLYNNIGKDIIKIEDNKNKFTTEIINTLNELPLDDNNSSIFKSDLSSTKNYPENGNLDSSELWSASEIEK